MASVTMKNPGGKDAGTVELDESMFGVQPNVPLMHQVVTAQLAARRSGTQSTKTRSDVRGGGAKPYRQKGTGNARQGSIRSPQFNGGGVAHGPKPRKYDQKTPKKMIKAALRSALSDRANGDKIIVVESWGIESPKTKDAKQALGALGIDGTALVVLGPDDSAAALSFRNLSAVQVIDIAELNAYDVLCNDWIVFTQETLPTGQATGSADAPAAEEPPTKKAPTKNAAAEKKSSAKKKLAEEPLVESDEAEVAGEPTESRAAEGSASDSADQTSETPTGSEAEPIDTASVEADQTSETPTGSEAEPIDTASVEADQTSAAPTDSEAEATEESS